MEKQSFKNIDEYIQAFPDDIVEILTKIRECIHQAAPQAKETISYNMPAFKQKKILAYFAAFKNHIGFYALPSGNTAFQQELSKYKTGKGSIQFPLNQEIPYDLIRRIVEFRLEETQ